MSDDFKTTLNELTKIEKNLKSQKVMYLLCIMIIGFGFDFLLSQQTTDREAYEKNRKQSVNFFPQFQAFFPGRQVQGRLFYDPFVPNSRRTFFYPRRFSAFQGPRDRFIRQHENGFRFPGTALGPPFYGFYAGAAAGINPIQAANRLLYRQSLQTPSPSGGGGPAPPAPPPMVYRDCDLLFQQGTTASGVVTISLLGQMVEAYCEMNGLGNNWLVIQRRTAATENFFRTWSEYEVGFGGKATDHWLGLLTISDVCKFGPQTLRVELQNFAGATAFAEYTSFLVRDGATNYRLEVSGYVATSTAGDALEYHNGFPFTTHDRDNDNHYFGANCAMENHGAWWYNNCYHANLNGEYFMNNIASKRAIVWFPWQNNIESLQMTTMMIKPNYS